MNGWHDIAAAASLDMQSLERALADPARQQAEFLRALLASNAPTAFGRQHGFERIRDVDGFRAAVPLRSDAAYAPWLEAVARGEPATLTADPPVAFESTGGTTGAKHIPYTPAALDAFRAGVLPWLGYLLERYPRIADGVAYVAASPLTRRVQALPCGLPLGLPSDAAYLGAALAPALSRVITMPPPCADIATWATTTMAHLAQRRDLTIISVWSPTFLLELLEAAPAPPRELWPDLQVVSMWMHGASAPYAARAARRLPGVALDAKGVLATESVITVGTRRGHVPALTSAFLEFIDAAGRSHLAHELRDGTRYRVALTTPGGLYRYDIGDEFVCTRQDGVPTLRFIGRAHLVSDLVGEKLSDSFVAQALAPLDTAAALVPRPGPPPHYQLWIDSASPVEPALAELVETRLRANPQYDYARRLGQLRPIEIVQSPGFARRRAHAHALAGGRLGDAKSSALLPR